MGFVSDCIFRPNFIAGVVMDESSLKIESCCREFTTYIDNDIDNFDGFYFQDVSLKAMLPIPQCLSNLNPPAYFHLLDIYLHKLRLAIIPEALFLSHVRR